MDPNKRCSKRTSLLKDHEEARLEFLSQFSYCGLHLDQGAMNPCRINEISRLSGHSGAKCLAQCQNVWSQPRSWVLKPDNEPEQITKT